MNEVTERTLCRKLVHILRERLPGIAVEGTWLPESNNIVKGAANPNSSARVNVNVGTRAYGGYTSRVAEIKVRIEGRFAASIDKDAQKAADAYGTLTDGILERWQADMQAVKSDLTLEGFAPVGFRLDGGDWETDADDRIFTQSFTLKGILKKERIKS